MESKLESLLKDSLVLAEKKFKDDIIAQKFEKTKSDFKEMVVNGLAHERGNNLLSISDDQFATKLMFNVK